MATSPVLVQGQYFWKDGHRFFVRGVVYQEHDSIDSSLAGRDVISDDHLEQLRHDLLLFQELGVNAIYVYSIDYTKPHAQAMKMLEEAGIYVLISLSTPQHCIHRHNPYKTYTGQTIDAFFRTIDVMASFPNTLGALVADQLINNTDSERCAPVIKAIVRDVKKYMALRHDRIGQRRLPIGFGGASYKDDRKILDYLGSGDEDGRVDFWTCTGFEWKRRSDTDVQGYDYLIDKYRGINIPIIVTEYGNNEIQPRTFSETTDIYSPRMSDLFSGGCAYELWQCYNTYGLASLKRKIPRGRRIAPEFGSVAETRETELGSLSIFEDFVNYKARLASTARIMENAANPPTARQEAAKVPNLSPKDGKIEGVVPESSVDWPEALERIEKDVRLA